MLAGRYGLEHALSQGGDTVVYGGYDSVLMRAVAVKIFYGAGAAVEVLGEARTAAGLNHPNIAQIYDYGEFGDGRRTPYLVMEFLDGETLADRLARTGAFRWREAAEICADISAAVAAAHAQNLVHGDVSARRVMLTPDGVKVLGFETATAGDPDGTGIAADMAALDLLFTECLMGSPGMRDVARLPRALHDFHQAGTAASVTEVLRRATGPTPLPHQKAGEQRPVPAARGGHGVGRGRHRGGEHHRAAAGQRHDHPRRPVGRGGGGSPAAGPDHHPAHQQPGAVRPGGHPGPQAHGAHHRDRPQEGPDHHADDAEGHPDGEADQDARQADDLADHVADSGTDRADDRADHPGDDRADPGGHPDGHPDQRGPDGYDARGLSRVIREAPSSDT
ncbi:protein kinase domain-containing protein [Paractinoplanes durhamensis]|uniref:protein kinase domain-containing protein n=1 Tax=Paractinoplanes durhamensis TaxID=113563 RepID=UPI0036272E85